ncbi:uracil-DNA glycosylase [Acidianus sp. RZ1]|uniref:uracil-DNA glycosylase n=1 Tax=Acidianus sp. RZ1 TaxID=1540082 RepID=UPI001490A973|nr:uracil-DNA glycosylase [Acidianus sp. RZ1]NON62271.1 uracil-DNA glycosylase [Acidianus sp. RZ1]
MSLLFDEIVSCNRCELRNFSKQIAERRVRRFHSWDYWGKPLPGFGDEKAKLLIVGLAPAAHGGNRTGRVFTGDSSGEWVIKGLYELGLSNLEKSTSKEDQLVLRGVYLTNSVKCVPPKNKPNSIEILICRPFLEREISMLNELKVILVLGRIAFSSVVSVLKLECSFSHGKVCEGPITLVSSYHPSMQNTRTGRLTWDSWIEVLRKAKVLADL